MLNNAKVTLDIQDFEKLRDAHKWHEEIASRLSDCFEYAHIENPMPKECIGCDREEIECDKCEIYLKFPPFTHKLTVDVERLIEVAKGYALYGKKVDIDDVDTNSVVIEIKGENA